MSTSFLLELILFVFRKSPYCVALIESIEELGMRLNCFLPVKGTLLHDRMKNTAARMVQKNRDRRMIEFIAISPCNC
jgi:hypothetical protein